MGCHNETRKLRARARPHRASAPHMALAALAAIVLAMPIASAEEAKKDEAPAWLNILALQLKSEYNCDLDEVLFDRNLDLAGKTSKEGKARCIDRREFDFSRDATHEKFTLKLCQPVVC